MIGNDTLNVAVFVCVRICRIVRARESLQNQSI